MGRVPELIDRIHAWPSWGPIEKGGHHALDNASSMCRPDWTPLMWRLAGFVLTISLACCATDSRPPIPPDAFPVHGFMSGRAFHGYAEIRLPPDASGAILLLATIRPEGRDGLVHLDSGLVFTLSPDVVTSPDVAGTVLMTPSPDARNIGTGVLSETAAASFIVVAFELRVRSHTEVSLTAVLRDEQGDDHTLELAGDPAIVCPPGESRVRVDAVTLDCEASPP